MYYYKYNTKIGDLFFVADDKHLLAIQVEDVSNQYKKKETEIIKEAHHQVVEYFKGERKNFDLPLLIRGSDFEIEVYQEMMTLEFGDLATYKDLAIRTNRPKAYRAVGSTCGKNPYLIVVPCHRVIKSDRGLGGYSSGLSNKEYLLEFEGHILQNCKVR